MYQTQEQEQNYSTPKNSKIKPILIIVGIVIILAVVISVLLIVRLKPKGQDLEKLQQTTSAIEQAKSLIGDCSSDSCKSLSANKIAKSTGVVDVCELLQADEKDNCIWTTARYKNDEELCVEIAQSDWRQMCSDGILNRKAKTEKDVNLCYQIVSKESQDLCVRGVMGPVNPSNCTLRGLSQTECGYLQTTELAKQARDQSMCDKIEDIDYRDECYEVVGISDKDKDGMNELMERKYGTSDDNKDSDGDGYDDYDEVKAGYNPAGPGLL
ncbi:MAG: hypothetical protein ABIH21_00195 [Patescibacteria group bacterium]